MRRPEPVHNSSPSITVIWLANDWLRLYVNSMSALDPGPAYSGYDGNGKALTAAAVKNAEAGVRLDLFKSKLLLNVVGFTMQDRDRPVNYGAAIQTCWWRPPARPTARASGRSSTRAPTRRAFDLKVDYIPLRNLRINVGFSQNDVKIVQIDPFATPANPDPVRLAAQQRFVAAGGSSSRYLGKPSTDIAKYSGTGFIRYQIATGPLKDVWAMIGAKYLGAREAEIISVSTATGDATITRFDVPDHYLFDFNVGYRRKIGRYNTIFQPTPPTSPTTRTSTAPPGRWVAPTGFSATLNF